MLKADTFLWAVGALCQLHRIPFAPQLLLSQFPPPYSITSLLHALKALGLRASLKKTSPHQLPGSVLPCLALLDRNPAEGKASAEQTLALILKLDDERLVLLEPNCETPRALTQEEFARRFSGQVLLARKNTEVFKDTDAASTPFGFRWFIPELLKYRNIRSEVLLASFAIQLVGLAVPVCTQIIIDKVVVHHTVSTLMVSTDRSIKCLNLDKIRY